VGRHGISVGLPEGIGRRPADRGCDRGRRQEFHEDGRNHNPRSAAHVNPPVAHTIIAEDPPVTDSFLHRPAAAFGKPVCRRGLAPRGDGALTDDDVHFALGRGVNFLNWPGGEGAISRVVAGLGPRREAVVACVQFESRRAADAVAELRSMLATLGTDYIDVLTFYYVEEMAEWAELTAPGGALEFCRAARHDGTVRRIGLTTHQRPLAAAVAASGLLDV